MHTYLVMDNKQDALSVSRFRFTSIVPKFIPDILDRHARKVILVVAGFNWQNLAYFGCF